MLPPMTVFLKNEYGKEKTDQEIDDAAVTNLRNIKPSCKMASAAGFRCYKVLAVVFTKHINQKNIWCSTMFVQSYSILKCDLRVQIGKFTKMHGGDHYIPPFLYFSSVIFVT